MSNPEVSTLIVLKTLKVLAYHGCRTVSASLIQRKMRIGYMKAAGIMQALVEANVVLKMSFNKFELCPEFQFLEED